MILNIEIKNRIATYVEGSETPVCGNGSDTVVFTFDAEWEGRDPKVARFIWGNQFHDEPFTGNTCPVPMILNARGVEIGVFVEANGTQEAIASTRAWVNYKASIRCGSATASAGSAEAFTNEAKEAATEAKEAAEQVRRSSEDVLELQGDVEDHGVRIATLENAAGMVHTTAQVKYAATYEELGYDSELEEAYGEWTSAELPQNVQRYARIVKLYGVYSTNQDDSGYGHHRDNPCTKVTLDNGVTIELPKNLGLQNFGTSEHDYIFFKNGKAYYHQGTYWNGYYEESSDGEEIAQVYDEGKLIKLYAPIITDISNFWDFDGFIDLEGATNIVVETKFHNGNMGSIIGEPNCQFVQAGANVEIQFELIERG